MLKYFCLPTYPNLNPPSGWFAKQLNKNKCIILLDGLDELADLQQRQKVSKWVNQQITNYSHCHFLTHCHFLITSRRQGYLTAPIEQANVLEMQAFDTQQVQRFVHAWYLENEVHSFGKEDEGVRNKAKQEADDLLQRLQTNSALNELTVNPLLLTLIVMVHRYQGKLPEQRVELYAEICDVLLKRWRFVRDIQDDTLTATQKYMILQPLAAQMMEHKLHEIHTNEAVQIIENPLQRVTLNIAAQDFLTAVQDNSGLLLNKRDVWYFVHRTFQEYLAAVYFYEQQTELNWNELVNDSWWHETLRLYAAQGDATELVQACLDHDTVQTLTLAVDLLEEARELERAVREQIEDRLMNDDLESEDSQRRQLAAKVRLKQRFKSLHRIDARREIDLDYITCAKYQLFLDEKRTQNEYYHTGYTCPQGSAQAPIRGIRAEDAKAFCEWLTQKQPGQIKYYHYRLPQHAEIMDYPPQTIAEHLSTWYQKNESYRFDWLKSTKEVYTNFLSAKISNITQVATYNLNSPLKTMGKNK